MLYAENMDNKKLIDNDSNENSEIINKLYSNDNISEKYSAKTEYIASPRIKDEKESERYIKEMHELADRNELRNNAIVICLGLFIASIVVFSLFMNSSFMKTKAEVAENGAVAKNTTTESASKGDEVNPSETSSEVSNQSPNKIYEYLNVEGNRTSALEKAVTLNKGSKKGVTVYLLSEILRANSYDIPDSTSSVKGLITELTTMGFVKNTDITELEKGDICFTTDMPDSPGVPSHAYIFMGWTEEGKTDYANICDGQVEEYGSILHKRNLFIATSQKDKFSFFLRK